MTIQALSFKTERDLFLINILSALLIAVIAFFPDSPARIILGLPFILFFPGYVLICALFPRKEDSDSVERLALSMGLSIAITSLMGLALNYTPFGIRLYPVTFSLFLFTLLMSAVTIYRRRSISSEDAFAPLASISMFGWFERIKNEFIKSGDENRVIKIIAIICFILIMLSLILIRNTEYTGYEASIYTAIPLLSWIFLIISIISGISIIVHQIYAREHERSNLWKIGLLLILLSFTVIISLNILRGYAMWGRGDAPTHLGVILNIISSGHIEGQNFYPALTIHLAQFSFVCDIAPIVIYNYVPIFFALLYILFMYLFAKSVLPLKGQVILATIAATASITFLHSHHTTLQLCPNHLANLFLPLAFFLLIKSSTINTTRLKMQFCLLFIIMTFLLPVFHPIPANALLLMLLTIVLTAKILGVKSKNLSKIDESSPKLKVTALLILFVWGFTWISSFYVLDDMIRNLHTLATAGAPTHLAFLIEDIQYAQAYGYSPLEQFLKVHGCHLIFIILTLVSIPIVLKRMPADKSIISLGSLYGPIGIFILITAAIYISNLIGGPLRIFEYAIMLSAIFVGFTLYHIIQKAQHSSNHSRYLLKPKLYVSLVLLILILVSIGGVLRFYPSSYVLVPNSYITQTEIEGMEWCFDNKDNNIGITSLCIPVSRFVAFLVPLEREPFRYTPIKSSEVRLPWHFGYAENTTLGESYTWDNYMVLSEMDRTIYKEVFPKMAELRFCSSDFEKLEHDPCVDKLYNNGGLDVWYIHSSAQ